MDTAQTMAIVKYVSPAQKIRLTGEEFYKSFRTKKVSGLWYCYGRCNGLDFSHEASDEGNSRIEMWQILALLGFVEYSDAYQPKQTFQLYSTSVKPVVKK